jgi:microcystin-dependent protein
MMLAAISGALYNLTNPENWEPVGAVTPQDAADYCFVMLNRFWNEGNWLMSGIVYAYAGDTIPENTLECDGSLYNRVDYPELYAALNSAFIVDADTFRVPDLRALTVIGANGTYPVSFTGGEAAHTLVEAEIPAHAHTEGTAIGAIINGGLEAPAASAVPSAGLTGYTGGGGSHNNMQPFMSLKYVIVAR